MWVWVLAGAVGVLLLLGVLVGVFFYRLALSRYTDKSVVLGTPHNQLEDGAAAGANEPPEAAKAWLKAAQTGTAEIISGDGLRLRAMVVENKTPGKVWGVLAHGYLGRAEQLAEAVRGFYDMGCNLLVPDMRGCGRSEGGYYGMGWRDREDILRWIDHLNREHTGIRIFLYGVSMGGAAVMMASGEALPGNVQLLVEDCGYTSVYDIFAYQLRQIFKLPAFPVMPCAGLVVRVKNGYWMKKASAVRQLEQNRLPILFIHGGDDSFVPVAMLDVVYKATAAPKER
ncbi:MAG: alpha/beta hydrolase, partial [Oscillospiraceae bacterium]